ncbi:hypothetical protein GALMADRAFT_134570 [Galerina marginata CBS 339.88]|uniref:G-protein coupled receptors family 1 profile domain-containing protein n=1 Tax=Galerina marginata (strain CBS 339.88) TaxID=685588 RepID=A0A067TIL9_GALM3|nr:hypothetical protein GALMADRAFT_134570 [Galerina marginata CBS 339.88]
MDRVPQTLTAIEDSYATTASAISYGIVLCLSIVCIGALSKSEKYNTKKRWFFYLYTLSMLLLSTSAMVLDVLAMPLWNKDLIRRRSKNLPLPGQTIDGVPFGPLATLPFIIGLADSLMAWRCIVLYAAIPRVTRIILLSVLALLSLAMFALLIISQLFDAYLNNWVLLLISLSVGINISLSSLIALRIRYHQARIRSILGIVHGSTYNRIVVMCIESCAIIVVFEVLCLIPISMAKQWVIFPLLFLPHICVISPLLIIYRVAAGIDVTTTFNAPQVVGDRVNHINGNIGPVFEVHTRDTRDNV